MDGDGKFLSLRGRTLEIVVIGPIILMVIISLLYYAFHMNDKTHLLKGNSITMVLNDGEILEYREEGYSLNLNMTITNRCKYTIAIREDSLKLVTMNGMIYGFKGVFRISSEIGDDDMHIGPSENMTVKYRIYGVPILHRPKSIYFVSEDWVGEKQNRVVSDPMDISLDPFCRRNGMFCPANVGTTLFDIKEWNGNWAECMVSSDLNKDGRMDMILCTFKFFDGWMGAEAPSSNNTIVVFLGKTGGFERPSFVRATGSNPKWLEAAELTGDDHIDLAVVYWNSLEVHILKGRGDGSFDTDPFFIADNISQWLPPPFDEPYGQPFDLRAADIDLDKNMDLIVLSGHPMVKDNVHANYGFNDTIIVLYGNAVHGYGTDRRTIINGSDGFLEVGDLNGDGLPDIIVSEIVFLQGPKGSFCDVLDLGNPGYGYPMLADIDDDGRSELFYGNRMFRFGDELVTELIGDHFSGPSRSTIADLDKDGRKDILRGDEIHFQTSNGTFDNVRKMHLDLTLQLNQQVRSINDVDGDGLSDIIYNNGPDLMVMYQSSDSDGDGIIDEYDPNENKKD